MSQTDTQTNIGGDARAPRLRTTSVNFTAVLRPRATLYLNVSQVQSANVPLAIPETLTCDVFLLCARVRFSGAERGALSSARRCRKQRHFSVSIYSEAQGTACAEGGEKMPA